MKFRVIAAAVALSTMAAASLTHAQQAQNNTEQGSLAGAPVGGSLESGKPAAGSFSAGRPAAGSLTMGKPSAGSLTGGKPAAGSLGNAVVSGSLSSPAGTVERMSGATQQRLKSTDDGTSYTRKPRERRTKRYQ